MSNIHSSDLKLRSVTYTIDLDKIQNSDYQKKVCEHLDVLKLRFNQENIFVRTLRFNTLRVSPKTRIDQFLFLKTIEVLSNFSKDVGIRWFNIAFDLRNLDEKNVKSIILISYEVLKNYSNSFVNFIVSDTIHVSPFAIHAVSNIN